MLVEIYDYGSQMEFNGHNLDCTPMRFAVINTNSIKYIFEKERELTDSDRSLLNTTRLAMGYYKVYLNDDTLFFIDYDDFKRLGVKELDDR